MASRKPNKSKDARARFDGAMSAADQHLSSARASLTRLEHAATDDQRKRELAQLLEHLMDTAYAMGLAEGHLAASGRDDPFEVPRFRQVAEQFREIYGPVAALRAANPTDRGRAAIAAGLTATAGALIGGITLGPAGAMVGSILGGAAGPYAFLRPHRRYEDLGDAVLGGGFGGLFTPVGAAVGAYWAGDELARAANAGRRAANPMATASEMKQAIERWLEREKLSSSSIRFATPEEWNKIRPEGKISDGFVVMGEGTTFARALGYGDWPEAQKIYASWEKMIGDQGWWWDALTSWAFLVYPENAQLQRAPNGRTTRRSNRGVALPGREDPPLVVEVRGEQIVVAPTQRRGEWVTKFRRRVRFGDRRETLEDIEYFQIYGTLPPEAAWANPGRRRKNGWVGNVSDVEAFLKSVGADKDGGRFVLGDDPPIYGMGGDEIVISDATVYYRDGRPAPLASALAAQGTGVPVRVF